MGAHTPGATLHHSLSSSRCKFEREKLAEGRRRRGQLVFLDRMQADSDCKRAHSQVCALRREPGGRKALNQMVERLRPAPELKGPKISTYKSSILYEGHDQKSCWAPLECY